MKKKQLLLIFITLLMSVAESMAAVFIDGIYYELNYSTKTADVTKDYRKYSGNIIIPESVTNGDEKYVVTNIEESAFAWCSELTSITIPNSVTSIGESAFSFCRGLTSITIPNSVTSIGSYAFQGCSGLTSIIVNNNKHYDSRDNCNAIIQTSSNTLIAGCINTVISYSVTSIGDGAFLDCGGLTSITIPNSVTSIGERAFENCSGLTSITIPNSVTRIGQSAFSYCRGLTSITIPNSVTSIGENAFSFCRGLTSITIPNSVTRIEDNMFRGCSSIASITIPISVTNIGENAFEGCLGLTSLTIPNSVTSIGRSAFLYCRGLTFIIIPNSVTGIEDFTFNECSGLTSITIPNSVTSIGNNAFSGCTGLTSIIIPNSVTSIGDYAFFCCTGLISITIPNSVTNIGDCAFSGCTGLTSITIPNSVTSIGDHAFSDCTGLTAVEIPNSVTSISDDCFNGCSSLTTVTLPKNLTSIGHESFIDCVGLTSFTIPGSVTSIGNLAFYRCSGLTDFYCYAEAIPRTFYTAFDNSNTVNATLHVPVASLDTYRATSPWNYFKVIVPIEEEEEDGDDLQRYLDSLFDTEDEFVNNVYRREFQNDDWQSLYVPFTVSSSDWSGTFKVARIDGLAQYGDNRVLEATTIDNSNLEANYPYLICAKSNVGATLTVNVSSSTQATNSMNFGGVTITGNYSQLKGLKSAHRYRMQGGAFSIPGSDEEVLQPYRWYMTIDNSAARELRISINGNKATGIKDVEHSSFNTQRSARAKDAYKARTFNVYTPAGRRIAVSSEAELESLPKGLYLINNKKRVIK